MRKCVCVFLAGGVSPEVHFSPRPSPFDDKGIVLVAVLIDLIRDPITQTLGTDRSVKA